MSVNSLPKTVTRQRRDCDLYPGPTAPESSTLTIQLPSYPPGTFKNKGTFLWNYASNSGPRKFRHGVSTIAMSYRLSSRKLDAQSVINWAVVGQLSR